MKVQFFFLASLFISLHSFGQSSAVFNPANKNEVYAFQPIGNVASSSNYAIMPDRDLSDSCLATLKDAFQESTSLKISYLENQAITDRDHQEYFMNLMERAEKTRKADLVNAHYGENIKNLIAPYEGRYFCFIFYSGLESGKNKNLKSTQSNTGELLFPLATEKSFLHSYLLIVDKKTGTVAYFKHNKVNGSPVKKSTVAHQVQELLSLNE